MIRGCARALAVACLVAAGCSGDDTSASGSVSAGSAATGTGGSNAGSGGAGATSAGGATGSGAAGGTGAGVGGSGVGQGGVGGSTACPPDASDTACVTCAKQKCCAVWTACNADTNCACFFQCMQTVNDIGQCAQQCGNPDDVTGNFGACFTDVCASC